MRFIFQIKIKQGHTVEDYVEAWKQASTVIQQMCGARGTYLHRGIGDPNMLLAIAEWDSKEARDHAITKLWSDPAMCKTLDRHLAHGEVSLVGEFEEPDWSVVPTRVDV